MKPTDIPSSYTMLSSGAVIPPQIDQTNALTNGSNTNIKANPNILNSNYIVQNNNFMSNSNCYPQPVPTINQASNHPNNLRFLSKRRNKRQAIIKRKFTDSEDIALASLVEIHGQNDWKIIAGNMPSERTPRQCRERWKYYLSEGVPNNDDWTHEEEKLLLEKYEIYGPHWAKIAKFFDHKNDINLKNRFNKIKRNKLSGMLFDPSMSEEFDHVTRDKSKDPKPKQHNHTVTTNTISTNNASDCDSDIAETNNDKNIQIENNITVPSSSNASHGGYFSQSYYSSPANGPTFTQSSFPVPSESSSMQSSASSGKNSSNASMLNSAHPETKFPIIINTFNTNSKNDKADLSESSGNNSSTSTSSAPPDGNSETNTSSTTIGYDDKNYRKKIQYSVQSLLLNDNTTNENRSDDIYNANPQFNNEQSQERTSKTNDGCRKIIEFPIPISLL